MGIHAIIVPATIIGQAWSTTVTSNSASQQSSTKNNTSLVYGRDAIVGNAMPGAPVDRSFLQPPGGNAEQVEIGTFALQNERAKTQAHSVVRENPDAPLRVHVDFWLNAPGSSLPISAYTSEMTKYAHVIIVSDDFSTFMHVHPVLKPDGHFELTQTLPHPGLYHIYWDLVPSAFGRQVFRFDLPLEANNSSKATATTRTAVSSTLVQTDGPYAVELNTAHVLAGTDSPIHVRILEHGLPANDLRPYLGVGAHAVLLQVDDLTYDHVHPMPGEMAGMSMDEMMETMPLLKPTDHVKPTMTFHVHLHEAGTYRMWLQFNGDGVIHTVPFLITAS